LTTKPKAGYTNSYNKSKSGNPNKFLGQRNDLTPEKMSVFVKKFKDAGATILSGCCKTRPSHIKEILN
jgi:homocysteine S-methyltransferase